MSEVHIRIDGAAGRITLSCPERLNALRHDMCLAIAAALRDWQHDDKVALVLIDGAGERGFCAGGDLKSLYEAARAGDPGVARQFWRDEYRLNLMLAEFPKPVVALMHGLTMGGGVGLGCHGSHRVVGASSRLATPQTRIGLVPDAGGSLLLAQAPGHLGEYLALTAGTMGPGDAIHAGFADFFLPEDRWPDLVRRLTGGTVSAVADMAAEAPAGDLAPERGWIDSAFAAPDLRGILAALDAMEFDAPQAAAAALRRHSPLSMAAALVMLRNLRSGGGLETALAQEFRFGYRAPLVGDVLEGIRARLIDRDDAPVWRHETPGQVTGREVSDMLAPLGDEELQLDGPTR